MKMLPAIVILLCFAAAPVRATGPTAVPFDMQAFVDHAVSVGRKRIVIPPGRYRVKPTGGVHLRLTELRDVTIIADGVEMVCTETTTAVAIERCSRLALRGLVIDYDPLPYAQGRIVSMSPDKSEHIIALFDGYPDASAVRADKYEIYRPETRTLRCDTYWPAGVDVLGPRRIRLRKGGGSAKDPEQVGDLIAIAAEHAPGGVASHAVTLTRSAMTRLVNVTVWASNCFGFVEIDCDHSTYLYCRIDRRPPSDDPVKREIPRIRSLNADAFHSIGAVHGPSIVGCSARFMGDDAVNIHGSYCMVTACSGRRLRVIHENAAPRAGDLVEIWTDGGVRLPDAVVTDSALDAGITPTERAYLMKLPMHEPMRRDGLRQGATITLDLSVDLPLGSLIAAHRLMGDGFLVKNCDFGFNRSRGIVIKASAGQVVGNRITGGWMAAILVSPEAWWMEAGNACGVKIIGNRIAGCHRMPLVVESMSRYGKVAPAGAHRDICVSDNVISDCAAPGIRITSVRGLVLRGNRISGPAKDAIVLEQCEGVTTSARRAPDDKGKKMRTPAIASDYVTVYRPASDTFQGPSTAELTAGTLYHDWVPNDHAIIAGPDGRWHAIGISHPVTSPANVHDGEQQLFHAVAPPGPLASVISDGQWTDRPKVLNPADRPGETAPIYAPHIVRFGTGYAMVYGPDPIRIATSQDLTTWKPGGPLFHEEPTTRDPELMLWNGRYYLVYCSVDRVMLRTSTDLAKWSAPRTILQMSAGMAPESPSLHRVDGAFYLFVCDWDGVWDQKTVEGAYQHRTRVYRSSDPLRFDVEKPIAELQAHAPEVLQGEDGCWYISSAEWPCRGISLARLEWR